MAVANNSTTEGDQCNTANSSGCVSDWSNFCERHGRAAARYTSLFINISKIK